MNSNIIWKLINIINSNVYYYNVMIMIMILLICNDINEEI